MKRFAPQALLALVMGFIFSGAALAAPVGTTFDYQGSVARGGEPADGEFEMEFRLFAGAASDLELAPAESFARVLISNGNFQVPLDFGALPFDGEEVWLEIGIRSVDAAGPLTVLSPRQPVRAIPYAVHAGSVQADAVGGGNIVDGSIESRDLADSAVTINKIDDTGAQPDGVLGFLDGQVQWLSRQQLASSRPDTRLAGFTDGLLEIPEGLLNASTCLARQDLLALLTLGSQTYANIQALVADEAISGANRYLVVFNSTSAVNASALMNQTATLQLTNQRGDTFFSGPITGLDLLASRSGSFTYRLAFAAPWGLLDLTRDYQVFQDRSVPEIIDQLMASEGLTINTTVNQTYNSTPLELRFDETAFTFIRRLMEREGLVLGSQYSGGQINLTLFDSNAGFGSSLGRFGISPRGSQMNATPALSGFSLQSALAVREVSTQGFADNTPPTGLFATSAAGGQVRGNYRFESGLKSQDEVDFRQAVRLSQRDAVTTRAITRSNVPQIQAGRRFEVSDAAAAAFNGVYVATRVRHALLQDPLRACLTYSNHIEAQPDSRLYVLPAITPLPKLPAVTSATVTGPAGEQLHTDFLGRIKIQFHFDGGGALDETSSPFVRVATSTENLLVGPTIPRIGSEVLVSFMDGDPNQPVVVGSLNNEAFPVRLEGSGFTSLLAGFYVNCNISGSSIATSFRTPPGPAASIVPGPSRFSCNIDLGFRRSGRSWLLSVADSAAVASASCRPLGLTGLTCSASDFSGRAVPAEFFLALY